MNVTVRQMRALLLVIELQSFTRAAQAMHLTQSALSLLVRQLENELGARLLDRTTRAVQPTAVGRDFAAGAKRVLAELGQAVDSVGQLVARERGRVVLAAPLVLSGTLLPTLMAAFRARHPGIELVLMDSLPDQVLPHVASGAADLAIGTFARTQPRLHRVLLFRESLVAVYPQGHPLDGLRSMSWKAVQACPVMVLPRGSVFRDLAEAGFAAAGLVLVPAFEATYVGTLLGLVKAGLGVAIVPRYATELADARALAWRRLSRPVIEREVSLVTRQGSSPTPAAAAFAAFVLEQLGRTNKAVSA